jgi:glycosyltransferase involved in cell wall biosynthesis
MDRSWPSVSVVIPTRDRPDMVRRAIAAIGAQTYPGTVESVVVFDQSDPLDLPSPDGRRPVVALRNHRAPGASGARNAGIEAATGHLLAFCDDDDEWLPDKLHRQVVSLAADEDAIAVSCAVEVVNGSRVTVRRPPGVRITHADLLRTRVTTAHLSTIVAERERAMRWGPFDEDLPYSYGEDFDWLLRATRDGHIRAVGEPLVRLHWHRASYFTARWETRITSGEYFLRKHPDFASEPDGLARLYGRMAFAHAGARDRREAVRLAVRSLRLNPREGRAYVALAVAPFGGATTVARAAARVGRGL